MMIDKELTSKTLGRYTILADTAPTLKGYSDPSGNALEHDSIWINDVFYERDYMRVDVIHNLRVIDEAGTLCAPVIKELEVLCTGYVCTWSEVFWMQGYAIIGDAIYFVAMGEDIGYYRRKPIFFSIRPGFPQHPIECAELFAVHLDAVNIEDHNNLERYMLLRQDLITHFDKH